MNSYQRCWAIIPAAGVGMRVGADIPKQYMKINGKTILEYSLDPFLRHPQVDGVVVVLAENYSAWGDLGINENDKLITTIGGKERFHSVLNGLTAIENSVSDDDWILVHDAARPCLEMKDVNKLINTLCEHPTGGILAMPVRDTMKRSDLDNLISSTVEREGLWHALTPQMFRYKKLRESIEQAIERNIKLTDEAQAMEQMGEDLMLVEGSVRNIKVTMPDDIELATFYLSQMENS